MHALMAIIMLLWAGASWAAIPGLKVTASDYQELNRPENVIDHSTDTRWSCQGECWLQIDLGAVSELRHIWIYWYHTGKRTPYFELEISDDGVTWEVIHEGDNSPTGEWYGYGWSIPYQARYLRFVGHGNSRNDWNSISALYPYSPAQYPQEHDWELYLFEEITASGYEKDNVPENVDDFDFSTHWTANTPAWIQFDLGRVVPVDNVRIAWKSGDKRKASYDIEVSEDGETWTLAYSGVSSGASLELETNMLDRQHLCRYVRIVGHGNDSPTQRDKNSITQVEIWGISPVLAY